MLSARHIAEPPVTPGSLRHPHDRRPRPRQNRRDMREHRARPQPSVVAIDYEKGIVWIKWLGTHKDYDQIEVTEVDYGD